MRKFYDMRSALKVFDEMSERANQWNLSFFQEIHYRLKQRCLSDLTIYKSVVSLQQQQLLYNGKEMGSNETLRGLGVADGDLVMMVYNASSAPSALSQVALDPDESIVNPAAFQQHIQNNADTLRGLGVADGDLVMMVYNASSAPSALSQVALDPDESTVNPAAFQQHIQNNASDLELAYVILGNDLNNLQTLLRA
nr:DNA damage-inducible protein 1 [Tanacetum cinerariifolium]